MASDQDDKKEHDKARSSRIGAGLAIGIGVGLAIGAAMDNPGAGLVIGIALGISLGASRRKEKASERDVGRSPVRDASAQGTEEDPHPK